MCIPTAEAGLARIMEGVPWEGWFSHSRAPSGLWLTGSLKGEWGRWCWAALDGSGLAPGCYLRLLGWPPLPVSSSLLPPVILQHLTLTHHLPVLDICLASWPRVLKFITSIYWKMYSLGTVKPSPFPRAFSNQVFRYLSCFSHFLLFFLVHGMFRFLASSLPCSSLPCFSIAAPL